MDAQLSAKQGLDHEVQMALAGGWLLCWLCGAHSGCPGLHPPIPVGDLMLCEGLRPSGWARQGDLGT